MNWWPWMTKQAQTTTGNGTVGDLAQLEEAVRDYLSEFDNPVPDAVHRRFLRNRLRLMVGAPAEPPPRRPVFSK